MLGVKSKWVEFIVLKKLTLQKRECASDIHFTHKDFAASSHPEIQADSDPGLLITFPSLTLSASQSSGMANPVTKFTLRTQLVNTE